MRVELRSPKEEEDSAADKEVDVPTSIAGLYLGHI